MRCVPRHERSHIQDLAGLALTKEQLDLVGKGFTGPAVALDSFPLTEAQVWTIQAADEMAALLVP